MLPVSPLFQNKHFKRPAVFNPENLMRETRRQKSLRSGMVPPFCILDPDGDFEKGEAVAKSWKTSLIP